MPARIRKIRHDENTRAKIQTAAIINRLNDAFQGKIDLTPQQVSIGLGLLKKTLPDLSATELSGEVRNTISQEPITETAWQDRYAGDRETVQ